MQGVYDIIVVGGGHSGCEAAVAAANLGMSTLLLNADLRSFARMSCNPAVGGIAKKSPFVMQMLCDVFGRPVEVSECSDACALGAAVHAAVAAGLYPSVLAAEDAMCHGAYATYAPYAQRHEFYLRRYARYQELAQFIL